jgi:hypothetical protein
MTARAYRAAADLSTFWILYGKHGPVMTMEQLRESFYPSVTMKTMQNKASARTLPRRTAEVFDTRDVADWWDTLRGNN